jgi:hypothetical protein
MINHPISHNKSMFDLFNMINPNCYQAYIIQCIIEDKKEDALRYCDELSTAFEYYKWDSSGKQSDYIDSLICESNFDKWQKMAIIYIISNDIVKCKNIIKNQISLEQEDLKKRIEYTKSCNSRSRTPLDEFCSMLGWI